MKKKKKKPKLVGMESCVGWDDTMNFAVPLAPVLRNNH